MASPSKAIHALVELDDEMEAELTNLVSLAIVAKPNANIPHQPSIRTVHAIIEKHYHTIQPAEIFYHAPNFILQFNDKTTYNRALSYKIIGNGTYTFTLEPYTYDTGCHTTLWNIPVTIDIHGIPPHMLNLKTICTLLEPYCEIEAHQIDKKLGLCTVEGTSASVESIPKTGFLSYPYHSSYGVVTRTFPITLEASLLTVPMMNSSIWKKPEDPEKYEDPNTLREIEEIFHPEEKENDTGKVNAHSSNIFIPSEENSSDDDDPNNAYYYPDSDREPMYW